MIKILTRIVILAGITFLNCGIESADLIIKNGNIVTLNENNDIVEAIAIKSDRILAAGSNLMIDKYNSNSTIVIDAHNNTVMPGFNDAHCHFASGSKSLRTLDFRNVNSLEKIKSMVADQISQLPPGALIIGSNYDHTLFDDARFPSRFDLDPVSPDNPVIIKRVDGHSCWVNTLTLKLAGITSNSTSPFGGEIMKDEKTGTLTGILKESAMNLLDQLIEEESDTEITEEDIVHGLAHANRLGITSIHTSAGLDEYKLYEKLKNQDKLTVRIYAWQYLEELDSLLALGMNTGDGDSLLRVGFLKSYIDGTLGSGTALMFDPYQDNPETNGLIQYPEEEFKNMISRAHRLGYQTGTHAIGDKGVNVVLNSIEYAQHEHGIKQLRHRIEHSQIVMEDDFSRYNDLGVIASMQPTHCTTDLRFCEQRIGKERSSGAYAWRTFIDNDVHIAFGTDWPVEPLDPMRGIFSAITRQHIDTGQPEEGWFAEQRLNLTEALKFYTLESAYASFEEDIKGSLERGKLADIIVLDSNIYDIPPRELLVTKIKYTIMGGRIVYSNP